MSDQENLIAMLRRIQRKAEIMELDLKAQHSLKAHDAREILVLAQRAAQTVAEGL